MKDLREAVIRLKAKGRGKDSLLAHINPKEANLLKALGGSGKINPQTGILEFDDGGGDGGANGGLGSGFGGLGGLSGFGGGTGSMGGAGDGSFGGANGFSNAVSAMGLANAVSARGAGSQVTLGYGMGPEASSASLDSGWISPSSTPSELSAEDQATLASLRAAGFGPEAASIGGNLGLTDAEANELGARVEAQIAHANLNPTLRQRAFGVAMPSVQGIAERIAAGATQSDITNGVSSGNLMGGEDGSVQPDTFGQIASFASPLLSIFSPIKLGLAAALGVPLGAALPGNITPGMGLSALAAAYSGYKGLSAASRALGGPAGLRDASSDISAAMSRAMQGGGESALLGAAGDQTGSVSSAVSAQAPRADTSWGYAPNVGWDGGVVNFPGMFRV